MEKKESDVEDYVEDEEAVDDPEKEGSGLEGVAVWDEDAPDLQDEGDFERDDDQRVDGDGYVEELLMLVTITQDKE